MTSPILSIKNLAVSFNTFEGEAKVIDHINLDVGEKETVGLVGETGCGKSVTLKTILGILPIPPGKVTNGQILFGDKNLLTLPTKELCKLRGRGISLIPQDPLVSLNPVFTIKAQFLDLAMRQGEEHVSRINYYRKKLNKKQTQQVVKKIITMLQKVQIPDPERVLEYYPYQLSGGMAQRILIAISLIGSPRLLLADEPTTALDVTVQKQIITLLKKIAEDSNLSMLYITHNLGVTRKIAKRVYIMYAGQIVEMGNVREIFNEPLHPYTSGLINALPKITREKFNGIDGTIPDYVHPPKGCRFYPRCPSADESCKNQRPVMIEVKENHFVACRLFQEGR
ncbi:MAG TPA: ABC transporter ATP-binding protein [Thermoplasmata archaeon]|nr:ABC transporter ATP-binding protein [Thermoplasmata archaeon]